MTSVATVLTESLSVKLAGTAGYQVKHECQGTCKHSSVRRLLLPDRCDKHDPRRVCDGGRARDNHRSTPEWVGQCLTTHRSSLQLATGSFHFNLILPKQQRSEDCGNNILLTISAVLRSGRIGCPAGGTATKVAQHGPETFVTIACVRRSCNGAAARYCGCHTRSRRPVSLFKLCPGLTGSRLHCLVEARQIDFLRRLLSESYTCCHHAGFLPPRHAMLQHGLVVVRPPQLATGPG